MTEHEQKVLAEAVSIARAWLNVRGIPPTDDNILKVAAHPRVREHAENLVTDLEKFRVR
jgi:hypothetical protein